MRGGKWGVALLIVLSVTARAAPAWVVPGSYQGSPDQKKKGTSGEAPATNANPKESGPGGFNFSKKFAPADLGVGKHVGSGANGAGGDETGSDSGDTDSSRGDGDGGSADSGPDSKSVRNGDPEKPKRPAPDPSKIQGTNAPEGSQKIRITYTNRKRPDVQLLDHGGDPELAADKIESVKVTIGGKSRSYQQGDPDLGREIHGLASLPADQQVKLEVKHRGGGNTVLDFGGQPPGVGVSGAGAPNGP